MDWLTITQQLGFPVAATFALAWVLLRITVFFGDKIYLPLQEKHFLLVAKLENSLDIVSKTQTELAGHFGKMAAIQEKFEEKLTDISDNQLKIVEVLAKLGNSIEELENRLSQVEKGKV